MKSQKGVTMISLIIYVMSFLNFMHKNNKVLSSQSTASAEWDMLNAYLVKETKQSENVVINIENNETEENAVIRSIIFKNGNSYVFKKENKAKYGKIYLKNDEKNFAICNYIDDFTLPKLDDSNTQDEVEGGTLPLEKFEIKVEILGKEYVQTYSVEQ